MNVDLPKRFTAVLANEHAILCSAGQQGTSQDWALFLLDQGRVRARVPFAVIPDPWYAAVRGAELITSPGAPPVVLLMFEGASRRVMRFSQTPDRGFVCTGSWSGRHAVRTADSYLFLRPDVGQLLRPDTDELAATLVEKRYGGCTYLDRSGFLHDVAIDLTGGGDYTAASGALFSVDTMVVETTALARDPAHAARPILRHVPLGLARVKRVLIVEGGIFWVQCNERPTSRVDGAALEHVLFLYDAEDASTVRLWSDTAADDSGAIITRSGDDSCCLTVKTMRCGIGKINLQLMFFPGPQFFRNLRRFAAWRLLRRIKHVYYAPPNGAGYLKMLREMGEER